MYCRQCLDISGDIDVDGTTNLDVVDIDGAVNMGTTLLVAGNVDFNGDLDVDGTTNLDVVDIDGAVDMASTLQVTGAANFTTSINVDGLATVDALTVNAGTGADAVSILRMGSANSGANKSSINFQNSAGSEIFAIDYINSGTTLDINSDLGGSIFTFIRAGGIVINQDSGDHDFRVESNGNANMLFVDGGNDRVGIGRVPSISNSKLEVGGADNVSLINVEASGVTGGMGIGASGLQLFHGASSKLAISLKRCGYVCF